MKYIYGLNKSGISLITFLKNIEEKFICWDDEIKIREKLIQSIKKINFMDLKNIDLKFIDEVFLTPGISLNNKKMNILKKNGIEVFRDLEFYSRLITNEKIIAVTGTNGKSTTTKLIGDILKLNKIKNFVGGNIGVPLLEFKNLNIKAPFHVIELSSFQLESAPSFNPFISILLNISPDHMDRYLNFDEYVHQKEKIINHNKESYNIISIDDHNCLNLFNRNKHLNIIPISLKKINKGIFFQNNNIVDRFFHKDKLISINKISPSLFGLFNKQNILAAYVVTKILKLNIKKFIKVVSEFKGLPHRMEEVIYNKKMRIINNSKATNVDASIKSLINYNNVNLILGGKAKENDFSSFINYKKKIRKVYIIGKSADMIFYQLKKSINCEICKNLEIALNKIFIDNFNKKNFLTLLFSPACTSFDQYKNFEERGNHFKDLISRLVL